MRKKLLENIELSKLKFDFENPRLPQRLHQASEREIINWMLTDASLLDLIGSILQNGFFEGEPLLAIKDENAYIIVEGNRRLASLKIIADPNIATVRLTYIQKLLEESPCLEPITTIPVIVYENREDVFNYLGYRHVTGVKSWGALHKARYVYRLSHNVPLPKIELYKVIARKIGSKPAYIKRILVSYMLYLEIEQNDYFKIENLNEENLEFSFLVDATTKYSAITNFLNIDLSSNEPLEYLSLKHLGELTKWLYEKNNENFTRVGESRNIKYLAQVVASENALKVFREGKPLQEAAKLTDMPDEIISSMLESALISLKETQNYLYLSKTKDDVFVQKLKEINALAKEIHTQLIIKKSSLADF